MMVWVWVSYVVFEQVIENGITMYPKLRAPASFGISHAKASVIEKDEQ